MQELQETWVWFLGGENLLEEEMATYFSITAEIIQWTEEPGRLQCMGLQRVKHDWATEYACTLCTEIYWLVQKFHLFFYIRVGNRTNFLANQIHHETWMNTNLEGMGVILINRKKVCLCSREYIRGLLMYRLAYPPFSWKTASLIAHQQSLSFSSGQKMDCSLLSWLISVVGLPAPLYHIFILHRGEKTMHFISVSFLTWHSITCDFMIKQLLAHITQLLMSRFVVLCCSVLRLNIPECDILCFNTSYW